MSVGEWHKWIILCFGTSKVQGGGVEETISVLPVYVYIARWIWSCITALKYEYNFHPSQTYIFVCIFQTVLHIVLVNIICLVLLPQMYNFIVKYKIFQHFNMLHNNLALFAYCWSVICFCFFGCLYPTVKLSEPLWWYNATHVWKEKRSSNLISLQIPVTYWLIKF